MSFQFKRFKDPETTSVSADNQLFVVIEVISLIFYQKIKKE